MTATRVSRGAISFSNSSHFPLMLYSKEHETGGVAAWARQALDQTGADRVGDSHEHDRHVRVACSNAATTSWHSPE